MKSFVVVFAAFILNLRGPCALLAAEPREIPAELLSLIPPELRYERTPLDEERNALPLWIKGTAALRKIPDNKLYTFFEDVRSGKAAYPDGEKGQRLTQWLESNREALGFFERGTARGAFQAPRDEPGKANPFRAGLRQAARIKHFRAQRLAQEKKFDEAAVELAWIVRTSDLMTSGGDSLIDHLIGQAIHPIGTDGIAALARDNELPEKTIKTLLDVLNERQSHDQRILRAEMALFFVPTLVEIHGDGASRGIAERSVRNLTFVLPTRNAGDRQQQLVDVFAEHPKPLDMAETLKLAVRFNSRLLKNMEQPWPQRDPLLEDGEYLKRELANDRKEIANALDFWGLDGGGREPLEEEELTALRTAVAKNQNPLGRHFVYIHVQTLARLDEQSRQTQAQCEAARLALALRLYRLRRGELPPALDVLVDAGILAAVPVDPFSNQPLRYSRDRRIIWSVGPDGTDDGGQGFSKRTYDSKDLVWPISDTGIQN